jgi:hypothetical protein
LGLSFLLSVEPVEKPPKAVAAKQTGDRKDSGNFSILLVIQWKVVKPGNCVKDPERDQEPKRRVADSFDPRLES